MEKPGKKPAGGNKKGQLYFQRGTPATKMGCQKGHWESCKGGRRNNTNGDGESEKTGTHRAKRMHRHPERAGERLVYKKENRLGRFQKKGISCLVGKRKI